MLRTMTVTEADARRDPLVLLVDDEPTVLDVTAQLLARSGFAVEAARSGPLALERNAARPADVVLTDAVMPGMSGVELIDRLRLQTPGIAAVLASGYLRSQIVEHDPRAGSVPFVEKPFAADALARILRHELGHRTGSTVVARHNVALTGDPRGRPIVFAHGFGCDQNMWRLVAPAFERDHRVVLFDHVGAGGSDLGAYDRTKYATLDGYADDMVELLEGLRLEDAVFVGHSVSAMIGALAAGRAPERFGALVMVGPSPRYLDDVDYVGGFDRASIDELLDALDSNYLGWSSAMGPVIMGNPDRPELGAELTNSFCRADPEIARRFARATFLADNRADLPRVDVPTLVLQCTDDVIAPRPVGEYVHRHLRDSELVHLRATGHCPNLSAPGETIAAIRAFLDGPR
jgi:sigma-B regulation protein RsbQ